MTTSTMEVATTSALPVAPTRLLRLAIKKRKGLLADKKGDMRKKLLLSATIQSLCRHIGEARAARRAAAFADFASSADSASPSPPPSPAPPSSSRTRHASKRRRHSSRARPASAPSTLPSEAAGEDKRTQTSPPHPGPEDAAATAPTTAPAAQKRPIDDDPFGLDEFFSSLKAVKLG